jgi:hypothetical protein
VFKRGDCAEKERGAAHEVDTEVVSSDAPVVGGMLGKGGTLGDKGGRVGRGGRKMGPEGQCSGMSGKPMGRGLRGCCVRRPAHPGKSVLRVSEYVLTGACMRQAVWATLRKEEAPDSATSGPVAMGLAQGCS